MSIGELARQTCVKVATIRYYERIGVLPAPSRTGGNYRNYSQEHTRRLRFVRRCRELGFSLDEVRNLFQLSAKQTRSCAEVCHMAEQHLQDVENKLADLNHLASELRRISTSCSGNVPMAECLIIRALFHI